MRVCRGKPVRLRGLMSAHGVSTGARKKAACWQSFERMLGIPTLIEKNDVPRQADVDVLGGIRVHAEMRGERFLEKRFLRLRAGLFTHAERGLTPPGGRFCLRVIHARAERRFV